MKFATCPSPQERSERISLSGTVSTSLTVPAPQTRKEANKLSGTAPTILTSPRVSDNLRKDLYCGTVSTRNFSALYDQKEALSKLEIFMRQENIKEDSNIRTVPDNFDVQDSEELICITEDSYGVVTCGDITDEIQRHQEI